MSSSNHKVEIVVGVKDFASRALNGIQNTVNHMGTGFSRAGTYLGAFNRNLDAVIGKMDRLANSMYMFNMHTAALQRNLKNITMIGGAVAGGLAVQGTSRALDFDYNMRKAQSRMGIGNAGRKDVSNYILNSLANKVSYTPNDLAMMSVTLGQGGVNSSKDMKAMLKTVSYFSEAVDAVPEQAAEMVISAAKGFGISMENSQTITDKLTVALNKSLLHVEELPHAIGELAGRANMYGQSIDSSMTALMVMRDQGISAAQGSQDLLHGLRQASRIGNDITLFKKTRSYFDSLGVSNAIFNPDTRKLKEFPDLIADMEKAMINKGFINPKYKNQVNNEATYKDFVKKSGGVAPADFWDSEKAMPLISRVFGAAGMTPVVAGLQAKYEEVDKEGNKTGKKYYGSEALRRTYNDVKNSDGEVQKTHNIMANSGKYQLEVLKGAWEGAQIRALDELVPLLKVGAEQLTKMFGGDSKDSNVSLGKFRKALNKATENLEKDGHPAIASVTKTVGNGAINAVEMAPTIPPLAKQIGSSFNKDIVKGDWGTNIISFPWSIVKNGIKFITDIATANEEFDAAVKKLPKDLQDPAKLIETLVKGGIVLMVTGAVVKTIELGVRGVSLALKGTKIATNLSTTIMELFTGKKGKGGGVLGNALGKNMAIKANIVNVYGGVVNGGKGGKGVPPVVGGAGAGNAANNTRNILPKAIPLLKNGLKFGLPLMIGADLASGALGGPSLIKSGVQSKYNPLNNHTEKKIDDMYNILKDPSKYSGPKKPGSTEIKPESNFFKPKVVKYKESAATDRNALISKDTPDTNYLVRKLMEIFPKNQPNSSKEFMKNYDEALSQLPKNTYVLSNSIISGFNTANDRLQNMKLNNAINIVVEPPQVNVTGNIADNVKVSSSGSTSFQKRESQGSTAYSRMNEIMQRRIGWR